jgi:TPR repeat protein
MYENAEGCEKNSKEALFWYTKSAESGCAYAQLMLGCIYENGIGVNRDPVQAHNWYSKEAEQPEGYAWSMFMGYAEEGNAKAQFILGCLYTQGRPGLETDSSLAFQWLQKSADQGYEYAQAKLNSLDPPEKSSTQSYADIAGDRRGSTESNTMRSVSCRWISRVLRGLFRRLLS